MIVESLVHRARIVKGWAFMALPAEEEEAVRRFLASGDTADLPPRFARDDATVRELYLGGRS